MHVLPVQIRIAGGKFVNFAAVSAERFYQPYTGQIFIHTRVQRVHRFLQQTVSRVGKLHTDEQQQPHAQDDSVDDKAESEGSALKQESCCRYR
jgi:hypothetical protein